MKGHMPTAHEWSGFDLLTQFTTALGNAHISKDRQHYDDMQYLRGVLIARLEGVQRPQFKPGDRVVAEFPTTDMGRGYHFYLPAGEVRTIHKIWYEYDNVWSFEFVEDGKPWVRFPADSFELAKIKAEVENTTPAPF